MAGSANFSVEKGDTFLRTMTYRNKSTQVPVNLSNMTFSAFIEKSGTKVTDIEAWVDDASLGKFSIRLPVASRAYNPGVPGITPPVSALTGTQDLATGIYQIEVKYVDSSNNITKTLIKGNFVVTN